MSGKADLSSHFLQATHWTDLRYVSHFLLSPCLNCSSENALVLCHFSHPAHHLGSSHAYIRKNATSLSLQGSTLMAPKNAHMQHMSTKSSHTSATYNFTYAPSRIEACLASNTKQNQPKVSPVEGRPYKRQAQVGRTLHRASPVKGKPKKSKPRRR